MQQYILKYGFMIYRKGGDSMGEGPGAERNQDMFTNLSNKVLFLLGLGLAGFILLDYGFSFTATLPKRAYTLAFCLVMVLIQPSKKNPNESTASKILRVVLAVLGSAGCLYAAIFWWDMALRPTLPTMPDIIFCFVLVLVVLEACRRSMGMALTLVCVGFILYGFFGNRIPGHWGHQGFTIQRFVDMTYMYADIGLWGETMRVAVEMVVIFIIYGSMLQYLGGGDFFISFANALAGKYRGGPAKVAVVSSAFFGSISGSPVANVVGTGAFTIPMMKRTGYKSSFAGAVEATASTGGQVMPPVMGAAAFLMADVLGVPYSRIAVAAIVPAVIFYFSLFVSIHVTALKTGLRGLAPEEVPKLKTVVIDGWHFLISPFILIYMLVIKQYSVGFSGLFAIIVMIVVYFIQILIQRGGTAGLIKGVKTVVEALGEGGKSAAGITVAFAATGIVISVLGISGLGLKLAGLLVDIAGGNLFLLAMLSGLASIILGMGLPTSACYLIVAVTAAPALITIGVPPISAQFFVLYYSVLCVITPPVALASYAAAGLAEADPLSTSMDAVKLGLVLFLIPFYILYNPALLMQGSVFDIVTTAISGILAGGILAVSIAGYFTTKLNIVQRVVIFFSSFLLFDAGIRTDILGLAICCGMLGWSVLSAKKGKV